MVKASLQISVLFSFLLLTRLDGSIIYVRDTSIMAVLPPSLACGAGTRAFVVTSGYDYCVLDTPEDVLRKIAGSNAVR